VAAELVAIPSGGLCPAEVRSNPASAGWSHSGNNREDQSMAVTKESFESLWTSGKSAGEIAAAFGISMTRAYSLAKEFGMPRRVIKRDESDDEEQSPTPEEIAAAAAVIRSRWSAAEKARRYAYSRQEKWSPPVYAREHLCPRA